VLLVCDGRVLDEVAALVRAGASGHLPDTIDARALTGAVRDVATGRLIIGDALTRRLLAIPERDDPRATLTRREQEILRLMAAGYTNRQIGDALILSPSTVKTHLTRIRIKLGTRGRAAAVAAAARLDLLTEPAPAGPARQPSAPGRDHWQRADERILELGTR
jgi:DNA-binding NarL/FixJ family response regulator